LGVSWRIAGEKLEPQRAQRARASNAKDMARDKVAESANKAECPGLWNVLVTLVPGREKHGGPPVAGGAATKTSLQPQVPPAAFQCSHALTARWNVNK